MMYAKLLNGGVLIKPQEFDGSKPYTEIQYEERKDYKGIRTFSETENEIVSSWEYVEMTEDEKREKGEVIDYVPPEELLNILTGGDA